MRKLLFLLFVGITISLTSCRKDFAFEPNTGGLEFSKDTVYLDTVFTNIGSSTYRLKVYNRSNKDISIPRVQLGKGLNSKYRIMVDGMSGNGKVFENVELLAKDSMFVFIEVTSDVASANPTDFLYTDQIQFTNINGASQNVELVTLIQDAYFIYPQRTLNSDNTYTYENIDIDGDGTPEDFVGSTLDHSDPVNHDEYLWGNDKPYVIYGYALVPDNETLNVSSGARIHFHANSGLIVAKNATLKINGERASNDPNDLSKEVIFEGDRLEPSFSDTPGQWGALFLFSNSSLNSIEYLTLKNATVGIYALPLDIDNFYQSKLNIKNSQIYNCSNVGILSRGAIINGENLVVNYCGEASLACTFGGNYDFNQCTFNNNWNSSKQVAVLLTDYLETETAYLVNTLSSNFNNSIIYGSNQVEYFIERKGQVTFNTTFTNCLFKHSGSNVLPSFLSETNTLGNIRNQDPKFKNVNKNQLQPQTITSGAYQKGTSSSIPNDILGNIRSSTPDIGAYNVAP